MRLKTITAAAFAAAAVAAAASPAFGISNTVTPTTGLNNGIGATTPVQVTVSGFQGNAVIALCSNTITAGNFNPSLDCDGDTTQSISTSSTAAQTFTFNVVAGPRPLNGWACGTTDSAVDNPLKDCYIRVSELTLPNKTNQSQTAISFASGTPVVPEVPYAALLPLGAVAALGAGLYLNRRKATSVA